MSYKATKMRRGKAVLNKVAASACAVVLTMGLMPLGAFAEPTDLDQETAPETVAVEEAAVVDEATTESDADGESAEPVEAAATEEEIAYNQENDLANSWRYANGERVQEPTSSLSAAVPNAWRWTDQGFINEHGGVIAGAVTKGIDISEHQGVINWDKVKADGVDFVIIRIGFFGDNGRGRADNYWARNVAECERLGIPYGVYVYSYCHTVESAHEAAQKTIALLAGHNPTLPVYFDLEESDFQTDISKGGIGDISAAFCGDVAAAGYMPGIYSSTSWWDHYLTDPRFDQWERWVAQWNDRCYYEGTYHVWQAASDGRVDGINGDVDVDFEMNWSHIGASLDAQASAFVERLYEIVLGRSSEAAGLTYYVNKLKNGVSAADVARDFLLSPEFNQRGFSNERRVEIAYESMLNRQAGPGEASSWLKIFDENMTFDAIIYSISNSQEWRNNCAAWGVSSAPSTIEFGRDRNYNVTAYVNRLYNIVLGRTPDMDGLDVQCDALVDGGSAAQTADAFFNSEEFENKGYDLSTQVELAYRTMLNRASDGPGKQVWLEHLDTGMTVRSVVYNFAYSEEFRDRCAEWGVTPGSPAALDWLCSSLEPRDRNIGVTAFVYRMYVYCLGRNADTVRTDAAGENRQCEAILSGWSAGQIATNFFASEEFANRHLSNDQEVVAAYRAFFDRFPDEAGYPFWLAKKQAGMSSAALATGFTESPEFTALCARYGVVA